MGHCKDCIFWTLQRRGRGGIHPDKISGVCGVISPVSISYIDGYGHVVNPNTFLSVKPLARIDGLSGARTYCELVTEPEFGCVQFKHKRLAVLK